MQPSTLQSFLSHLRQLTDPARTRELSDADLLERFRSHREEAAFALLVQRHGPMVYGVCRRVLGDHHDTEDAFQATFLVLVRNAGAVRKQQSLASFLYGIASRIAHKMRVQSACRRRHERAIGPRRVPTDPLDPLTVGELRAVLDEEIAQLPVKYRMPLILCYLAEKTHEQAAHELGWPKSSVTARLTRARQILQQRLIRRGFTMPAGLLAVLLTEQLADAALPAVLTLSTVRLAVQALQGEMIAAATPVVLADNIVKGTAIVKWIAGLTLLATLGFAAAVGPRLSDSGSPPKHEGPPPKMRSVGERRASEPEAHKPRVDRLGDPLPDGVLARMDSGRLRHGGHVRTLAFAPDGKSIVSAGGSALCIWDAETGKLRRRFNVDTDWSLTFAFTNEGIAVANAGLKKRTVTVQLLDPTSGKVHRQVEMDKRTTTANLSFSPGGKRIAFSDSRRNTAWICDSVTGRTTLTIPTAARFARDIAFAPDGKTIAIADYSDTIVFYDTENGKIARRLKRDKDTFAYVRFSPDSRFLASIPGWDRDPGEIVIWDLKSGKELHRWKSPSGSVLCAAFSPDSKSVAMGCQHHDLILWDLATGKEAHHYPTDAYFGDLAFSPDGRSLAAVSGTGTIRLWDVATGQVLPASADPFIDAVRELRFSADGQRLLGRAATYIAWDPTTGREIRRFFKTTDYHNIALSPDESLLADADREGTIHLREATTGKEVRTLKGHEKGLWRVIFSPDGRRLASSSYDGTIRVWDTASSRQLHRLANDDRTMYLSFSPDGRWLASASDKPGPRGSYEVVLWDPIRGQEKARFALVQDGEAIQITFSPDSRLLAAVGGEGRRSDDPGEVKVWDVVSGKLRHSLDGHKTRASSVAFSPDGRTLATGDADGTLLLWEMASGRKRQLFAGHESWIKAVAFSPDGRMLASSSYEAPVYLWDVTGTAEPARRRLVDAELRRCWSDLAGDDASAAFQAIRRLAAAPEQTPPFLHEHLKPVPVPDLKRVRRLVEMLDSNEFKERRKAAAELEKRADAAASLLRQILTKEKPSLEVHRTLQQILEAQETAPESLRAARAVEVLEWIATPDAKRLLGELAKGAADARLTRETVAAAARLRQDNR